MNGSVAQIVALTCFGNAALAGWEIGEFFPANSTAKFCEAITFARRPSFPAGLFGDRVVAETPEAWFQWLRREGAQGLYLSWAPGRGELGGLSDRKSAGLVGGGGKWQMTAVYPQHAGEPWLPIWEVGKVEAPEKRIWRVRYRVFKSERAAAPPQSNLPQLKQTLAESLSAIKAFAAEQGNIYFSEVFGQALAALEGKGESFQGYHKDLAPSDFLPASVIALLDAAQIAWVFGGMGSWNDLTFEGADQERYETLSEQLFQAVISAIVGGANSSFPAA